MTFNKYTITSINGIKVGHVTNQKAKSGCTIILCPQNSTCAIDQKGGAPGTRDTDCLRSGKLIDSIDAIVFSGGSNYGLATADGVMKYLRENDRGLSTPAGRIPIVPSAIIYDLLVGDADFFPNAEMGYEACVKANARKVSSGRIGAGTGATIGSCRGIEHAKPGGIGNAGFAITPEIKVCVMLVVNAFGDIIDQDFNPLAASGPKDLKDFFPSEEAIIFSQSEKFSKYANTIIGVVATNACLSKDELQIVANMAQSGLARAVFPSHTPFDGDTIFAVSTGTKPYDPFTIGTLAQRLTQEAVYDAVRSTNSN